MNMSAEYCHGDELECSGYCGVCDACNDRYYDDSDRQYQDLVDHELHEA